MFNNCKWVVVIEKTKLGTSSGEGEIMQFDYSNSKNACRHIERFERLNSNKKQVEMI
jgi:hypothetical protein